MGDTEIECRGGATTRLLPAAAEECRRERPKEPYWRGECVKSVIYGGLDAIITCFSLISSISAAPHSSVDVLVLGLANLVADAISMGLGDFLSSKAEQDVLLKKRQATKWDVMNRRSEEQNELIKHYEALGMENIDATMVASLFAKYDNILVDQRMEANSEMREVQPWKNGLVSFVSFMVFGFAPLLSFVVLIPFTDNDSIKFVGSCIVTALVLALLGMAKARIASKSYVYSVSITLFNGSIAAAAAYSLGRSLKHVTSIEE